MANVIKSAPQLFTSDNTEWETPKPFFDVLNSIHMFDLDVCATPFNSKCESFYTKADDCLSKDWQGHRCWMNPPYGRDVGKYLAKALYEGGKPGTKVVCLLPARTDTHWWHSFAMRSSGILFVRGRLTFVGAMASAPFPSAVIVFDGPRPYPVFGTMEKCNEGGKKYRILCNHE